MKDERKFREIQEEKEESKERQAHEEEEEEYQTKRERSEAARQGAVERYDGVSGSLIDILGQNPQLRLDRRLSPEELIALEVVHKVKLGQNEEGAPANSRTRRLLLNQALASLQPILSLALDPRLRESLIASYQRVQSGVQQLRDELKTAQLKEMHSGKGTLKQATPKSPEVEKAEVTEQANLAWELVQLWKKRKKRRFGHDLQKQPVGHALAAIAEQAAAIAEAAAVLARAGEKLAKERSEEARHSLRVEWEDAAEGLVESVQKLVDLCNPRAVTPSSISAYPRSLMPRFEPIATRFAGLTTLPEALAAGAALLEEAIGCEVDQDEIVTAEGEK